MAHGRDKTADDADNHAPEEHVYDDGERAHKPPGQQDMRQRD